MSCVIYARVSTTMQNENNSVSLDAQEQLCKKYAKHNNIKIKRICKEVCSAYQKIPHMLNAITSKRNITIICADVSRFSRSVELGLSLANKIISNGGKIIFITESIIYDNINKISILKMHLDQAETESQKNGMRIKRSNAFIRSRGGLTNGIVPYGFNYITRITKNKHETNIVKFIKLARNKHFSVIEINNLLQKIKKTKCPIELLDKDGFLIDISCRQMTYHEISELLNSYNIYKRDKKWTHNTVKSAVTSYDRQLVSSEFSMVELANNLPQTKRSADDELFADFCKFRKLINSKKNQFKK